MSWTSIRPVIKTTLEGVSNLAFVDDKHHSDLTGFPAATFELDREENNFLTNAENLRKVTVKIILHQEISVAGRDEAERILGAAMDAVVAAFEASYSLGGTVDYCTPMSGNKGVYQSGSASILYNELSIDCFESVLVG